MSCHRCESSELASLSEPPSLERPIEKEDADLRIGALWPSLSELALDAYSYTDPLSVATSINEEPPLAIDDPLPFMAGKKGEKG